MTALMCSAPGCLKNPEGIRFTLPGVSRLNAGESLHFVMLGSYLIKKVVSLCDVRYALGVRG